MEVRNQFSNYFHGDNTSKIPILSFLESEIILLNLQSSSISLVYGKQSKSLNFQPSF